VIAAVVAKAAADAQPPVPPLPPCLQLLQCQRAKNLLYNWRRLRLPARIPRVFLTSSSKGNNQGAARDQSMEMSKDFEKDCPNVRISINQQMADYTVALNHIEIGLFVRDNQFQIANKDGDLISTTKEGGSIAGV